MKRMISLVLAALMLLSLCACGSSGSGETAPKKAEGGKIHFVLPKAVGDVKIVDLTVEEVIRFLK